MQFVDGHTLFDYNVGLNEIVQLLVKPETPPPSPKKIETNNNEEKIEEMEEIEPEVSTTGLALSVRLPLTLNVDTFRMMKNVI